MPRTGESIYKRKDGRWEARYKKGMSKQGKIVYGSVYGKTKEEVEIAKIKYDEQFEQKVNSLQNMTVEDAYQEWLLHHRESISELSYVKYRTLGDKYIKDPIGSIKLAALSDADITDFQTFLSTYETPQKKSLSDSSIRDILTMLKQILSYQADKYNIILPKVIPNKLKEKEIKILTDDQQAKLLAYVTKEIDVYKLSVIFALYTGMSAVELCALQWNHIDRNMIHVSKKLNRVNGSIRINRLTKKEAIRDIPIAASLEKYIDIFRKENGYVLELKNGAYVEPRLLQLHLKKILDELEIKDVSFQTLRHTFAVNCIKAGVDVVSLSKILGLTDTSRIHENYGKYIKNNKVKLNI